MSATFQPYREVEGELADYFGLQGISTPGQDDERELTPLAWAVKYRRIDDQPFSLDYDPAPDGDSAHPKGYEPLRAIYEDDHPFIVIMKPAQVGVSELAITRAMHALEAGARYWGTSNDGLNVGYLFPTQDALYDFSKERISALKEESPRLANFFTDFDDVGFKKAGHSYLYIRGAWSTKALKSFKADFLIFDEYDEMLPRAAALAVKRLRHSQVKRQMRLSTPTLPDHGIHAAYLQSDQREWEIHCSRCGEWRTLDFFRDVKVNGADYDEWRDWTEEQLHRGRATVDCPACRRPLSDADRFGPGRWIARRPEITRVRGYHVPALSFPSVSLSELCVAAISTDPEQVIEFYRSDLGMPYEPKGSRITEPMLDKLSHDLAGGRLPTVRWRNVTMGVDVGARFHYRVSAAGPGERRYVLAMGSVKSWAELDELMAKYMVRHCVIDKDPELHAAEAWARKHKGRVTRAYYPRSNDVKGRLFFPDADKLDGLVQINRTMAMDTVYNLVATGSEHWPAEVHNDQEVRLHMTSPVRMVKEDDNGQPQASWVHTKPDHLFHACVYDLIAGKTLPRALPAPAVAGRRQAQDLKMI